MTINLPEILRDLEIKRAALLPEDEKPRFDGGAAVHGMESPELDVRIVGRDSEQPFQPVLAATIVGNALEIHNERKIQKLRLAILLDKRIQKLKIVILILKIRNFRIFQQKASVSGESTAGVYMPSRSDCVIT